MPVSQHCLFEVLLAMLHSKPKVLIIMFLKSGWECIWGLGVYFLWGFLEQGLLGSWSICSEEFQHGSCPGDRKCITTIAQQGWISKNSNGLPSGLLVYKVHWTESAQQEIQSEGIYKFWSTCFLNRSVRPYHIDLCQADVDDHMFWTTLFELSHYVLAKESFALYKSEQGLIL